MSTLFSYYSHKKLPPREFSKSHLCLLRVLSFFNINFRCFMWVTIPFYLFIKRRYVTLTMILRKICVRSSDIFTIITLYLAWRKQIHTLIFHFYVLKGFQVMGKRNSRERKPNTSFFKGYILFWVELLLSLSFQINHSEYFSLYSLIF